MAMTAASLAQELSWSARSALLKGQFPVPVSPERQELWRFGLVDEFGDIKTLGRAVTTAIQKRPKPDRAHKYDACACFVTPDFEIVLAKKTCHDGKKESVEKQIGWERFDSKREGKRYIDLMRLQRAGEIQQLQRQIVFPLFIAATKGDPPRLIQLAKYIADFVYVTRSGQRVIEDAKGHRTREYQLKRKWLKLQEGLDIVEV